MNELARELSRRIRADGPLSIATFMELALQHPRHGYYRRATGIGTDFVTAPETTQAFGEVLGAWLAQAWNDLGRPAPTRLVELGPGSGALMADLLRATATVVGFESNRTVHLIETSEPLRRRQAERLGASLPQWHAGLEAIPRGPMLLLANEFFDALPSHQLELTADGWAERRIGLDPAGELTLVLAAAPPDLLAEAPDSADLGAITEISPARSALAGSIAARLLGDGGVAVVIDYGAWADGATGDTLQAARAHARADPLTAPGEADLTTQVDFGALARAAAAAGAAVYGPVPQGTFLTTFGLHLRIARLLERVTPDQGRELRAALFRLSDPSAMGEVYKVLVIAHPDAPPPPGFGAPTLTPC